MSLTPLARGRACLLATALAGLLVPAGALGAVDLVYGGAEAADAILGGTAEVLGLSTLIRQAPVADDRRWTPERLMGKVTGRELAAMPTAEAIAAALRENASIVTAIVRLWPVGAGPKRNLRKVTVGHRARTVTARLPRYVKPGRYQLVVSIRGQGLTDMVSTRVRLVRGRR